jgi:hypothetical protein
MRVLVSSVLHGYTGGRAQVEADGSTLAEVVEDLDRQFPGLRFRVVDEQERIRPHMRIFIDGELARDLGCAVQGQEIHLLHALSGG